jgi:hypothetical protein
LDREQVRLLSLDHLLPLLLARLRDLNRLLERLRLDSIEIGPGVLRAIEEGLLGIH